MPTDGLDPARCPRCGIRPTRRSPAPATPAGTVCAAQQRAYLDDFWARADIELDGDPEIQQAVRFSLFHVLQAGARAEGRAIPAKGLTGPGYNGHSFWDTEAYVLPVLTQVAPDAAAHALRWRHSTLPMATARATQLGLAGAAFPWRTIHGEECSSYWPAGTDAFHINADIADAVIRYLDTTGDQVFEREVGVELLAETARLWASSGPPRHRRPLPHRRGHRPRRVQRDRRQQRLHQPDGATEPARRRRRRRPATPTSPATSASTRKRPPPGETPPRPCTSPTTRRSACTRRPTASPPTKSGTSPPPPPDQYPLLLHYPYFDLYRKQVVKQADLVLAMHRRTDAFTPEQKARNFAYYERLTVRDSSLSACTQAVIAAEVGHTALAYDYLAEAALMDLDDLEHNTRDGLHIAALAGSWIALIAGLAGMRDQNGALTFAPRLPDALTRLAFTITMRGRRLGRRDHRDTGDLHPAHRRTAATSPTTDSRSPCPPTTRSPGRSSHRHRSCHQPTQVPGRAPTPRHHRTGPHPY